MDGPRTGSPLTLESPKFDFFTRGEGSCIVVKGPRLGLGDVSFGESTHRERLFPAERAANDDGVAGFDVPVRLGRHTIDVDLAAAARFLRFRSSLEEARDVKPDIKSLELIHQTNIVSSKPSLTQLQIVCTS